MKYSLQNLKGFWDFARFSSRVEERAKRWALGYQKYLRENQKSPPFPGVIQIIPTEKCNLRCRMCNQWGESGYFLEGKRDPSTMPIENLLNFLEKCFEHSNDYLLSIHGGEPFMYPEMDRLLKFIEQRKIDCVFSTNGTLLNRHSEALAKINRHTIYLLSIDGGETTNDKIRGAGTTKKIISNISSLQAACRQAGTGFPKLLINYCVNEHNPDDIDKIEEIAKKVGAHFINYNLRWFLPREAGEAYDKILTEEFRISPSQAWTGWMTSHEFRGIDSALEKIYEKRTRQYIKPFGPWSTILPRGLSLSQAKKFYHNYQETFGIKSCFMPSYWLRIHSNGDLIYCPGHPDIIPGNVFKEDVLELFQNATSEKLRKRVEKNLLPICNRCCGLYMNYPIAKRLGEAFFPTP